MRILIVGAGATGGYFGARLLDAGRDATFLVRPARAAQLAAEGLTIDSPCGNLHIANPPGTLRPEHPYDLIVLSCKAQDLAGAMDSLAPAVGPDSAILPLLNGMAHMQALDQRFGAEHVLGGATNISSVRTPEGRILHLNTVHRLYFGDRTMPTSPRLERIAAALADANFESHLRPDIQHDLWQKWVAIATAAGITCLMRAAAGDIVAAGAGPLIHQLLDENASIASAEGFPPQPQFLAETLGFLTRPGSRFTASMLRDIESNHPIEAQAIIGDLLALAHRHALPVPLLTVVDAHLRAYEARRRHP